MDAKQPNRFRPSFHKRFMPYISTLKKLTKGELEALKRDKQRSPNRARKRIVIASDLHGTFADLNAVSVVLQVLRRTGHSIDQFILNGDIVDFPFLSRHDAKLWQDHPLLESYSEVGEIKYTRKMFLEPLAQIAKEKGFRVLMRWGNHDYRFLRPLKKGSVTTSILEMQNHFGTTKLEEMLGFREYGFEVDNSPNQTYQLAPNLYVVHGVSTSVHSGATNLRKFGGGISLCTGHTHKLALIHNNTLAGPAWSLETGCLRHIENVEYAIPGTPKSWVQGMGVIDLMEEDGITYSFPQLVKIDRGHCYFEGVHYVSEHL